MLNNFKRLGVAAEVLDGKARLAQLHAIFHMDEQAPFQFEWDWLAPSGLFHQGLYRAVRLRVPYRQAVPHGKEVRGRQFRADSGPRN